MLRKLSCLFLLIGCLLFCQLTSSAQSFNLKNKFIAPTPLLWTEGLLVHSSGDIYIGCQDRIDRFDSAGTYKGTFATQGSEPGQVFLIHDMDELPNGNLLVGEYGNNRLSEWTPNGQYIRAIRLNDRPYGTQGVAVLPDGRMAAVDHYNNLVYIYNPDGSVSTTFPTPPNCCGLEVDADGFFYLSVRWSGYLVKCDISGNIVKTFGNSGIPGQTVGLTNGLRLIGASTLAVTDDQYDCIWLFGTDGSFKERLSPSVSDGIWQNPRAVDVDSNGDFIVCDSKWDTSRDDQYPLPALVARYTTDTIDTAPPISTFSSTPSTSWAKSDVTATINASDVAGGKGVKEVHYTVNMGAEQVVTGSSASFTLTEEGIHSIAYWAVDNAGNIEATKYATVRIDKTAPTVDGYVVSGKLMLMASDSRSGVAGIKYSLDGAAAADYSAPLTIPAGAHTYSYWSVDNAGNESVKETILVGSTVTVTIAPTSVYASKAAAATIRLSVAAPAGGVTVMLSSDNPAVTIAPSVKFNAGATTINVPVQTGAVAADTSAVITASIGGTEAYGTLTVLVPFPKTLTIAPNVITGGNSAVGTITLQSNAPAGGQVVTLTSMHPDVTVPASVTIPAGAISATFSVATKIASRDYSAAIYAEADGAGVGTTVLVKRVTPKSITFAPSTVPGGNASVGTVTLNVAAPAGGAVVQLKSTSTFVTVPTSVTVAEGQTTATFDIATSVTPRTVLANVQATAAGVRVAGVLTVSGVNVTSITLAPNSVLGGTSTTGTVNLNTNAPTGGLTVQLYTSTGIAGVPTSVTVLAGQKTATFTVTTVPVSVSAQTQIVGKYLGVAKTATLTVQAPAVSTVTLNPTSVKGGTDSTMTIKLTGLAGPSGLVVTLSSSNLNAATVPATVTVPSGTDTVDVVVTTKVVTANTTSTITAKTSAGSKTAVLTVNK